MLSTDLALVYAYVCFYFCLCPSCLLPRFARHLDAACCLFLWSSFSASAFLPSLLIYFVLVASPLT